MLSHERNEEYKPKLGPILAHGPEIKIVYLQWSDVASGLILKVPTGMAYSQPAGGYGCYQPFEEGAFFPLTLDTAMTAALDQIFIGQYGGWCTSGIDEADADALDALFQAHHFPLAVDRKRLKDSKQAWVHGTLTRVDETSDDRFHPLVELSGAAAVFTFENSD